MHENITRISHGCSSLFSFFLILTAAAAAPLLHCIHGSFVGPPPQENPVQAASRLIVLGLEVICHAEMLIPGLCTSKYESNLAAFKNFNSQFNGHLNKWMWIMIHFNTMVDLVLNPLQYHTFQYWRPNGALHHLLDSNSENVVEMVSGG